LRAQRSNLDEPSALRIEIASSPRDKPAGPRNDGTGQDQNEASRSELAIRTLDADVGGG
jgi:hypothetical protein